MRANRTFFRSISLAEAVRATAALTICGSIAPLSLAALPDATPDAPQPATQPAPQPSPSAPAAAPAQEAPAQEAPAQEAPAQEAPAPRAPAPVPQPEPAAPATPPAATTQPQPPVRGGSDDPRTVVSFPPTPPPATPPSQLRGGREGRRTIDDAMVKLAVKNEPVESLLPLIYEWTGKYVSYKPGELSNQRITIVGDREIPKSQALDYLFQSLKMQDLAVTETEDIIYIGLLTNLARTQPGVVLGPDEDVMAVADNGLFVTKIFRLKESRAVDILERIESLVPEDYARLSADGGSNQIILSGDIGLAKKVQTLLDMLDVPAWDDYATETFRLQFQDANTIRDLIEELFSDSGAGGGRTAGARGQQQRGANRQQPGQQAPQGAAAGTTGSNGLVVTVLPSMNSLTVRATPQVIAEIRRLVANAWDLPPNTAGSIFRVYDLKYANPVKVRDLLGTLLGSGTGGGRTTQTARAAAGGRALVPGGATGGDGSPSAAVQGIFSIEAYPDSNRLVMISKTPENYEWLDRWIQELDQPFNSGLPVNVPLKHAGAVELAEILNTLLAQSGSESSLRLPEEGLSGLADSFNTGLGADTGTPTAGQTAAGGNQQRDSLRFPWQGGRAGQGAGAGGEPQEVSGLIGRSRIVPNPTQNSVLVMAPPEVEKKVIEIIEQLDRPGRQVMITAILAEVKVGDGFSWGARVGTDLSPPLNGGDNAVGGSLSLSLRKGNINPAGGTNANPNFASPWFDASELNITTGNNLGFFLQALSSDNSVRILQQPKVYTSDNKEAKFVAGSDVSLLTGTQTGFNTGGTTQNSYQQQFVGVGVNVRPRITQDNNVAMEVEILLSNLSSVEINGNPVIDRRQTNTSVTVKNGQTIVISGIRREQEGQIDRRIPFLGDIPILGAAFSSTERQKEVVELLVFLVPVVVENPDDNDGNFNVQERERLKQLQTPLDAAAAKLLRESKAISDLPKGGSLDTEPQSDDEATGIDPAQKTSP